MGDLWAWWLGGGFMPHGHCYLWTPAMVWSQVTSNALIGTAYLSISLTLVYLVRRVKLPFSWVYLAFGTFILACGMTHFLDVVTVWNPIYWVDAGVRIVTAIASVGTALLVFPLVPKVVALSRVSEVARERGERLEVMVEELTAANARLSREQAETARLAAENAILAERARTHEFQERFIAVLGHDLRNPLAGITMAAELLRTSARPSDLRTLDRLDASALRMSRMIEQVLDLTRARLAGGLELEPEKVDVGDVVERVVDELRLAHPRAAIELRRTASLETCADRDRLEQVFSNLVGNALHHGLADRPVVVETIAEDDALVVRVHNEGPPIEEALQARIFDPFRRGPRDSRTTRTSGLGLGLYISREVVTAHGGTLDVVSTEAAGTTFRVRLPRRGPAATEDEA